MSLKYKTEGEIDFFAELYKSLDNDIEDIETEDNETKKCLISQLPLTDKYVELNCGHSFNYIPLYNDLVNFKNKFNLMEGSNTRLKNGEIRCPYCRKKHNKLLPYYVDLGLKKINGVNCSDLIIDCNKVYNRCQFLMKNEQFNEVELETDNNKKFIECVKIGSNKIKDTSMYGVNKYYCYCHVKLIIQEKEQSKQKLKEEKEQSKQKLKEEKEQSKQKLKEEKTLIKNFVLGPITIEKEQIEENNKVSNEICIQILKSGPNKGNKCNCKNYLDNLCKRHYVSKHKEVSIQK
jgi:hypothetical protein